MVSQSIKIGFKLLGAASKAQMFKKREVLRCVRK